MSEHHHEYLFKIVFYVSFISVAAFFLMACAYRTGPAAIPIDSTTSFSESGMRTVPDEWWTEFQDVHIILDLQARD
jgi:hypothetical protein